MKTTLRLSLAILALGVAAACTLQSQDAPSLTGPSEFGLSLDVRATPDVITQDGGSQSLITITARDHNSRPVAGLGLIVQTYVNGVAVDYGRLNAKSLVTNSQGQATVIYTAPPPPPATVTSDTVISILVTPVGSNYDSSFSRSVGIRLSLPGVILPPNGTPVASFTFSPTSPLVGVDVNFDASASRDDGTIVAYEWSFGDGQRVTTTTPRANRRYDAPGTYVASVTVVDDRGLRASAEKTITVGGSVTPTARFTFSPTDPRTGTVITFDASQSTAPEGRTIVSYRWAFGDGTEATGRTVQKSYSAKFTYTVTLTITDSSGRTHSVSQTVAVENP